MDRLNALWRERKVMKLLVQRDLRVRYSQSFLGYLWTVIDPLANALIYFLIFVVIFKRADAGYHPYFLFLISGLLPWQWYNATVGESTRALVAEARLVKSTKLPREIWVVRLVNAKLAEFVFALPVLVLFLIIYMIRGDTRLDWEVLFFPLGMVLQYILLVGLGLILAPLTVLVNDLQPLVRIYLRLYFYMTPIIFNMALVADIPGPLKLIFQLNPLTGVLELYRSGFFDTSIRWQLVGISTVMIAVIFAAGSAIFARLESTVLKEI